MGAEYPVENVVASHFVHFAVECAWPTSHTRMLVICSHIPSKLLFVNLYIGKTNKQFSVDSTKLNQYLLQWKCRTDQTVSQTLEQFKG